MFIPLHIRISHQAVRESARLFSTRVLNTSRLQSLLRPRLTLASRLLIMSSPASKRQKMSSSTAPYEILYWPSLPGRAEPVRLCFEETGTPYTDVTNADKGGMAQLLAQLSDKNVGDTHNPPCLAPPMLRHGEILLSQLPNIMLYLAPKLGLAGPEGNENAIYHVNQLALTALDGLSNEAHDTHHPVGVGEYYEDQKEEAKKASKQYIEKRLPKFLGYFERVLQGEASKGGEWLYAGQLTFADLTLWHCLDGVTFAFPKAIEGLKKSGNYEKVFAHYERIKEREKIKAYLGSDRRKQFSMGIYRHYPELDAGAD